MVRLAPDAAGLRLTVSDNGHGFDPATAVSLGHQGLENMESRAAGIGATMGIDSGPTGTTVAVTLPAEGVAADVADAPGRTTR